MKDFAHIDKTAPRVNNNILDILTFDKRYKGGGDYTFFETLKDKYPNLRKYSNLTIKNYIISFNKLLAEKALEHIDGIVLPSNMGHIIVSSYKKKKGGIDLKTSDELGKVIRFDNLHSEGYTGLAYYTTTFKNTSSTQPRHMYENWKFWEFTPNREFRQGITREFRLNWKRFRVIGKHKKVHEFIDKDQTKAVIKCRVEKFRKNYDEFDFN